MEWHFKSASQWQMIATRRSAFIAVVVLAALIVTVLIHAASRSGATSTNEAIAHGKQAEAKKDHPEAMRWYRIAADQGNADAQIAVGAMYYFGQVGPQNYPEALRWFRLAADRGDARGQFTVGIMYEDGAGVTPSYSEAMRWYRLAADQGYAAAQNTVGVLYAKTKNYPEALRWFRMAADQGNLDGKGNLKKLTATPPQITPGEALGTALDILLNGGPVDAEEKQEEERQQQLWNGILNQRAHGR